MPIISLILVAIGAILLLFGQAVAGLLTLGLGAILAVVALVRTSGVRGRYGSSFSNRDDD